MKIADSKNPILVEITYHGRAIGRITPNEFKQQIGGPVNEFLQAAVERFNAIKERRGEPERAGLILNTK